MASKTKPPALATRAAPATGSAVSANTGVDSPKSPSRQHGRAALTVAVNNDVTLLPHANVGIARTTIAVHLPSAGSIAVERFSGVDALRSRLREFRSARVAVAAGHAWSRYCELFPAHRPVTRADLRAKFGPLADDVVRLAARLWPGEHIGTAERARALVLAKYVDDRPPRRREI